MGLQLRLWLLVALMMAIVYGVVTGIGVWAGAGNAWIYLILALGFVGVQYLVGPGLVSLMMRVKWVKPEDEPQLHGMVAELAAQAGIPTPRVGISYLSIPNAFAFGRSIRDGRVCVTQGIRRLLNREELRAVLGHELSHLKHRDMLIITLLSAVPLMLYWIAWSTIWGGMYGRRRSGGGYAALIGLGAMLLYFLTNLLVLYGSRIREYYADRGSVELGNPPHQLASALYRLVYGSARLQQDRRARQELQQVQGIKAFFVNDVSRASQEIRELRELDRDLSGTIDAEELLRLRQTPVKLRGVERFMELFTTHPNMLKRIKHLSTLS